MRDPDAKLAAILAAQHLSLEDLAWLRQGALPPRLAASVRSWQSINRSLTLPVQLAVGLGPAALFALTGAAMILSPQTFSHEVDPAENRSFQVFGACIAMASVAWGVFGWGLLGRMMNRYRSLAERPRVAHVRGTITNVVEVPTRYGCRFDARVQGVPVSFDGELFAMLDERSLYDVFYDAETRLQYLAPAVGR